MLLAIQSTSLGRKEGEDWFSAFVIQMCLKQYQRRIRTENPFINTRGWELAAQSLESLHSRVGCSGAGEALAGCWGGEGSHVVSSNNVFRPGSTRGTSPGWAGLLLTSWEKASQECSPGWDPLGWGAAVRKGTWAGGG